MARVASLDPQDKPEDDMAGIIQDHSFHIAKSCVPH